MRAAALTILLFMPSAIGHERVSSTVLPTLHMDCRVGGIVRVGDQPFVAWEAFGRDCLLYNENDKVFVEEAVVFKG